MSSGRPIFEAFLKMQAVISTLIPGDPPAVSLRKLSDEELLGYADALDGFLEDTQREWTRRKMERESNEQSPG